MADGGDVAVDQSVGEGRLSGPGLAQQDDGPAGDEGPQVVDALVADRRGCHDVAAGVCGGDVGSQLEAVDLGKISFGQHDDRDRTSVPGQCDGAGDASRLHRPVEPTGDQDELDVGRQGLGRIAVGSPTGEK